MNRLLKYHSRFFFILLVIVMICGGGSETFGQSNTVSVPLYELPGRKMSLPVNLVYNTRGIKVDAIASPVGMNWDLSAGGAIRRVVRGEPDELHPTEHSTGGFCNNTSTSLDNLNFEDLDNMAKQKIDGEPDLFYYYFPGGSGSFVVEDNQFYTIPYKDVLIESSFCSNSESQWTITDSRGFKYIFGATEASRESLIPNTYLDDFPLGLPRDYVTSWNLTQIIGPDGVVEFSISYTQPPQPYKYSLTHMNRYELESSDCDGATDGYKESKSEYTVTESYPAVITGSQGRLEFDFTKVREDVTSELTGVAGALALENLRVVNDDDVEIFRYEFLTSYSQSLASPSSDFNWNALCSNSHCKRLFLDGIDKVAGTSRINYRIFSYHNRDIIPWRNSPYKDHWGYFNHNISYDPPENTSAFYIPKSSLAGKEYGWIDKKPSTNSAKFLDQHLNGMLSSIELATGGIIEYEYIRNSGRLIDDGQLIGNELTGPGLSISQIRHDPGTGVISATSYEYDEGYFFEPQYAKTYQKAANSLVFIIPILGLPINDQCVSDFTVISEEPSSPLGDFVGSEMRYGSMREIREDGAYTQYDFTGYQDQPDGIPQTTTEYFFGNFQVSEASDPDGAPFSSYSYRGWKRGQIKQVSQFDVDGNEVARTSYAYEFSPLVKKEINAVAVSMQYESIINTSRYTLISQPSYMIKSEEYLADMDEPWDRMTSSTSYEYEQEHNQLVNEITTGSDGSMYRTTYTYPFDYVNATSSSGAEEAQAIAKMEELHMHSVPVEIVQYKDDEVLGASLQLYKDYGTGVPRIYPCKSFVLETGLSLPTSGQPIFDRFDVFDITGANQLSIDNHYPYSSDEPVLENISYDPYGNVTESKSNSGLTTAIYEYDTETHSLVKSSTINGVTTTYTYRPLVGVLTETDRNGQKIEYEYDVFGRLEWIKDHKGNYLQRYEYSYVNEQ